MKKFVIVVIVLLFCIGCSPEADSDVSDSDLVVEQDDEAVIDDSIPEVKLEPIPEVIDPKGSYYSDDDSLPCVIIDNLRIRDAANGNIVSIMDGVHYAPIKCYRTGKTVTDDKYTWMKADFDDVWFALSPEWINNVIPNQDINKYSLEEREDYKEGGFYYVDSNVPLASQFPRPSYDDINSLYPMDEDTFELCRFLKKAIPGMCWMIRDVVDFDARNPSEEAKERIAWQIHYYGPVLLSRNLKNVPSLLNGFVTLKEHSDYYTEKIYGNIINLQTVQYYDSINQVYRLLTFLNGHGSYVPFPIVLSKDQNESYIKVQTALIEYEEVDRYNGKLYLVDNENHKDLRGINTIDYIENQAKKCECVLKVTENGEFQLITVRIE